MTGVDPRDVAIFVAVAVSSQASPSEGARAVVSYKLARQRVVAAFRAGNRTESEVCDAQPELRRVAHNHASLLGEDCPICGGGDLVAVTFAFGSGLPKGGRCISDLDEVRRIERSGLPAQGYRIEVCRQCWWNHLLESFPIGAASKRRI